MYLCWFSFTLAFNKQYCSLYALTRTFDWWLFSLCNYLHWLDNISDKLSTKWTFCRWKGDVFKHFYFDKKDSGTTNIWHFSLILSHLYAGSKFVTANLVFYQYHIECTLYHFSCSIQLLLQLAKEAAARYLSQDGYFLFTCVCLFVCQQDYTKTALQISRKLGWRMGLDPE